MKGTRSSKGCDMKKMHHMYGNATMKPLIIDQQYMLMNKKVGFSGSREWPGYSY